MAIDVKPASPRLEQLLAGMGENLRAGRVPLTIYGDPEIYELELDRIFGRAWTFVAHESEIAAPGDFVLRYIGDTRWIVTRDEGGRVHVLFDSCRHRGARICRADKGNASHFTCPYHGWTYKNDGALIGVPNRRDVYRSLDERAWSLLEARVDTHQGLIFACLDSETAGLREYLGDFAWYLDYNFGLAAGGLEVVGDPSRWVVTANWKTPAENFAGDTYHTQTLHRSIAAGIRNAPFALSNNDVHVVDASGHAMSIKRVGPDDELFWGMPPETRRTFFESGLTAEQYAMARRSKVDTGTVFPNLTLIHSEGFDDPTKPGVSYVSLAQFQPKSATSTEIWRWVLVPKGAPKALKARIYRAAVSDFGPAGNFEQDDTIVWGGIAESGHSRFARNHQAELNYEMGMPGMGDTNIVRDWPGPGVVVDNRFEDGVQQTMLRHWLRMMLKR
jgi:phenylpropionate dioxygenase-like ring-hydroxylating dioxygenase large terminal subunit